MNDAKPLPVRPGEGHETFRSKVDGLFLVSAGVVVAVSVAAALGAASTGTGVLPALVMLPGVGLVFWIWRSTRYVVTDTSLLVTCGLGKFNVPLAAITAMRRTSTVLAAPALSLDRIEVQHAGGLVVISPAERERFVSLVIARNPQVDVSGVQARTAEGEAHYRRQKRTVRVAVAAVLLAIAGLLAALNLLELSPALVTVGDRGIVVVSGPTRMVLAPRDITSLALEDTLPPLKKRVGWGSYTALRGRFSTDRAAGWVHVSRRKPPFIVLETADSFLILNDTDAARTRAMYETIDQRWRMSRQ